MDLPMIIHEGVMVLQTADAAQLDKLLTRRPVRERLLVRLGPNRALFPATARPELMKRLDAAHIPSQVTTIQTLMEDA